MKSIASAPAKIILFGEHFVVHGTKAILAAIDKRVTVTSSFTEDDTLKINSELGTIEVGSYAFPQEVKSELRPFVGLAGLLRTIPDPKFLGGTNHTGLEITIDSDIPIGVGLGSSSACCVAAAASIYTLFREKWWSGRDLPDAIRCTGLGDGETAESNKTPSMKLYTAEEPEQIGADDQNWNWAQSDDIASAIINKLAIVAERTIFPYTSGADCTVCTWGGVIEYPINFSDTKWAMRSQRDPYAMEDSRLSFDLDLLIANSMIPHSTKRSVEKVSKFKERNAVRFSQLCDLESKLIDEAILAMKNNDVTTLGLKMLENQKYLEEIQVSNDTLRDMISSLSEISLGSKITGAGDGGCIIALVKDENMDKVTALLPKDKEYFSAKIDTKGVVWEIEE